MDKVHAYTNNIRETGTPNQSNSKTKRIKKNVVTNSEVPIISLPDEDTIAVSTTWEVNLSAGNHAEIVGHENEAFGNTVEYEEILTATGRSRRLKGPTVIPAEDQIIPSRETVEGNHPGEYSPGLKALGQAPLPPNRRAPPLPARSDHIQRQGSVQRNKRNKMAVPNRYVTINEATILNHHNENPQNNEDEDDDNEVEFITPIHFTNDSNALHHQPYFIVESTEIEDTYLTPSRNAPPPSSVVTRSVEPIPKFLEQDIAHDLGKRYIKRKRKETVYIKLAFLKVGEIRTKHEDFSADIFVQAKWREKKLDKRKWIPDYEINESEKYWNPEITIENGTGSIKESVWHVVTYEKSGHAYICEKRRIKGIFSERLELKKYPFDTQKFTVTLMSNRRETEVILQMDPGSIDDVTIMTFVDEQEWSLHKTTEVCSQYATFTNKKLTFKRPKLSIAMKATRKASFFLLNIVMVMIFICSLIFTTFSVDYNLVQNRLQLCFILMLSNVTFKNFVSGTLPKISYMTYLDHYVIWQTTIMFFVSVWHALVFQIKNWSNAATADQADMIALIVFGGVYVIVHIVFFTLWGVTWYKTKKFTFLEELMQ